MLDWLLFVPAVDPVVASLSFNEDRNNDRTTEYYAWCK